MATTPDYPAVREVQDNVPDWVEFALMCAGGIVCLAGVIAHFGFTTPGPITDEIGLFLFLAGILIFLYKLQRNLQRVSRTLITELSKISEMAAERYQIIENVGKAVSDNNPFYTKAIGRVINDIVVEHLPAYSKSLGEYLDGKQTFCQIKDNYSLLRFIRHLAEEIDSGWVWLGITKVENKEVWDHPPADFAVFREALRTRAKKGEIHMARIFYFDEDEKYEKMKPNLDLEIQHGIKVKYVKKTNKRIDDITLLWRPPLSEIFNQRKMEEILRSENLVNRLVDGNFSLEAAIEFDIKADQVTEMILYGKKHQYVDSYKLHFQDWWKDAITYSNESSSGRI